MKQNKKIYKIRNKQTGEFISLGYTHKKVWYIYPYAALKENWWNIEPIKDTLEVVQYEYELKEVNTLELKLNEKN